MSENNPEVISKKIPQRAYKPGPEPARSYSTPGTFTVVLWGPTNVGKSTLFNKLTSTRKAIVANRPGVTVDTHQLTLERDDFGEFRFIDSGGVGSGLATNELREQIESRAMRALADANLVLFVVDGTKDDGELPDLARILRKELGKFSDKKVPVAVVVNKADRRDFSESNFFELGFENVFPVSAEHSKGVDDVWSFIVDHKVATTEDLTTPALTSAQQETPRVLILGRPNVGKSTLMNYISGKDISAVSNVAGTTRDFVSEKALVDNSFEVLLTDTAGMRRPGRRERDVEWVATNKIVDLSRRADVAVLVLDADEGVTDQDSAIAGFALDAGLSLVIALNKWDKVKENPDMEYKFQEIERSRDLKMAFLEWCPVVRISAKTGLGVKTLKEKILEVTKVRSLRVPTAELNSVFESQIKERSGAVNNAGGARERLYYMSQVATNPPEFVLFCNMSADQIHFSFRRYVTNVIRDSFGFIGTPIRLYFKKS